MPPVLMMMKTTTAKLTLPKLLTLLLLAASPALAQGTAFTYNGRLNHNGAAANGAHDLRFTLYDADAAGVAVGGPLSVSPVEVANGLFTVRIDFGVNTFTGPARWLQVEVRPMGGADYTVLSPRQEVTSSPYAIRAQTAGSVASGTVTAGQLNTGLAPTRGQFLSYDGGNLMWSDPGVAAGNIWSLLNGNAYLSTGNVGIGTSTPTTGIRLDVVGATLLRPGNGNIQFGAPNGELGQAIMPTAGNRADLRFDGATLKLLAGAGNGPPSSQNGIAVHTSGNVSIGSLEPPQAKLQIVAQDALSLVGYQPFLTLADANAGYMRARLQSAGGEMIFAPESYLTGADPNAYAKLSNTGNLSVKSLTIRGGADLAEPFTMSQPDVAAGSVVVIDDANPGKLRPSTHAYDKKVAGIVSGAHGIEPGISLYQEGMLEGGQNVALSGRVYVLADASSGEITPGDLLTTSTTPGHAMKVSDDTRSQGAILGKAMSALKDGQGMVLVLVTLQ